MKAISLPALVNEGMWALGTTGYNMIYGHMGTDNYAALTIFRTVENLAFVFFVGLCHACSVLIGKRIGAGDFARARLDARRFTVLMTAMSVTVGLALIALRTPLLSLFNVSEGVRGLTRQIVLLYGLEIGLRNIPYITIVGVFRAGGDTRIGVILDTVCVWCIALPLTFLCGMVLRLPFVAVYLIMLLSEDVVKTFFALRYFLRDRWIHPVTEQGLRAANNP